ncbi:uncharacterized protein LOC126896162 isoform X9 [Daktulosphaira vitifoliae]|uniref:uncharacterized protein LOC126896162 isoform X9 n=1 Tax=Daktulosphaira vitifoliae TaxID=58002 RepID=UPI0021AB060C|nr:uncharacterized protein LOC126896162 isoform X9 [Daktulosphaira vitifoliae]
MLSSYENLLRFLCFCCFGDFNDNEPMIHDTNTCIICMEKEKTVTMLPCEHMFCNKCVLYSLIYHKFESCPQCQVKLSTVIGLTPTNISMINYEQDSQTKQLRQPQMTEMTFEHFQELRDNVENFNISNAELLARYVYLRRDEKPDKELSKDIQSKVGFKQFSQLIKLRKCIVRCTNTSMELLVYMDYFKLHLDDFEKNMLTKFYLRQGLIPEREHLIREQYFFSSH